MSFIVPAYLIVAMGGFSSLSGIWVPTLTAGAVFAAVQLLVATYLGPQLTDILAAIASIVALVVLLRFLRRDEAVGTTTAPLNTAAGAWTRFSRSNSDGVAINDNSKSTIPPTTASARFCMHGFHTLCSLCVFFCGGGHHFRAYSTR